MRAFVELLRRHQVEFLVIGGQAESLMGSPRATYDTDLCYRRTTQNLMRLAAALRELKPTLRGAPPDLPIVIDERALVLGSNYTFDTAHGKLDLLGWVEPIGDFDAIAKRAETYPFEGGQVNTISLDDLIRVKQHIGRTKDRDSLLQLLAIKKQRKDNGLR
jgi:hypothetical protein